MYPFVNNETNITATLVHFYSYAQLLTLHSIVTEHTFKVKHRTCNASDHREGLPIHQHLHAAVQAR